MLEAVIGVGLAILAGLVIYGSVAKNRWGINLKPVLCPKCGTRASRVRLPSSFHQALWGGFSCPKCGCETDKWGRPRSAT